MEFIKCEQCSIIFPSQDSSQTLCPKCRKEESKVVSDRDMLRALKNTLRDAQTAGMYLTVAELSRKTDITEERIWRFIHAGEIDTASFNDPGVRDFVVKRQKERLKTSVQKPEQQSKPDDKPKPKVSGFHLKIQDDKPK
jgi:hypothetical protein